ncbi:MAG: hypothetical protein ABIU09_01855 [Pyrinomonadaceae bacterium]
MQTQQSIENELLSERWSVVSFEKCEASDLTYADAKRRMTELERLRVTGLCIVTDEAATRIGV